MVTPRRFVIVDDNTIREKRDHEEERRPRKRKRMASEDEGNLEAAPPSDRIPWPKYKKPFLLPVKPNAANDKESLERDPVYFEDGTNQVTIRIENVLFKFCRDLLDCSKPMQNYLKQHENEFGPTSESNPFWLESTAEEFRAFLWALNAPLGQLRSLPGTDAQLTRIFNIATASSTFYSPRMTDWVAEAILNAANSTTLMDACASATLSQFVDVAVEHDYHAALKLVIDKWCNRLLSRSAPSVPAIQAADRHEEARIDDLKKLRGVSYYVHVQDMLDRQTEHDVTGATHLRTDPKLNNGQVMRLLAGYWSLVNLWERLRLNPIPLPQASACPADMHEKCASTWSRRWTSAAGWKRIIGHNSADILTLLDTLRDQLLNDDDLKSGLHYECRIGGLDGIKKFKEKTKEGLADHFVGCL